ncbi:MAG: ATP-binding protein [Proteobacteria bacterium]|nr:ATP-binding protein [Pseudomonadota bacterium]
MTSLQRLPKNLEAALLRLSKGEAAPRLQTKTCALNAPCKSCEGHRGVFLESDGVFIRAKACACVQSCQICCGTCVKPNELQGVAECKTPSPLIAVGAINDARIPGRYLDADLKKFSNFTGSGRQVIAQLLRWIDNFVPGKSSGLLLTGSVGVGKTYILSAIAKSLALNGVSVRFADFFQLVNELRESYAGDSKESSSLKPLHEYDVLIIDELGKGRNSEWEVSIADSLISDRYNGNKCVVASTNYALKDNAGEVAQRQIDMWSTASSSSNQMNTDQFESLVRRLGPRIYSRLKEMTVFLELSGDDFRRQ